MGLLISRLIGFSLRVYAVIFTDPLTNVAPYGACNEDSRALAWLEDQGTADQSCIEWQGLRRCWFTFVPNSAAIQEDSVPVVIHLHGAGGCASLPSVGWGTLAQDNELIVVWPQGTKHTLPFLPDFFAKVVPDFALDLLGFNLNCWNDGSGLFGAEDAGIDDMGFLEAMITQISTTTAADSTNRERGSEDHFISIDTSRIYLSGHSNGATMAQRFALQTSGLLAGVVAVSGAGLPNDPEWTPGGTSVSQYIPTPIILIAGTIDGVVPFDERAGPLAGAIPSFDGWGTINGCSASSRTEDGFGAYAQHKYEECDDSTQVTLIQVFDAGHHPFSKGKEPFKISPVNTIASKFPYCCLHVSAGSSFLSNLAVC